MTRTGFNGLMFFLAITLLGCVLSISPPTSETIVLDPGETARIEIRTSGLGDLDRMFTIADVSDPSQPQSDTPEKMNLDYSYSWPYDDDDIELNTATYTPNEESAGRYEIHFGLSCLADPQIDPSEIPYTLKIVNAIHSRTWEVVVRGVAMTPKQNIATMPGTTLTYAARAYPEGDYTYQWLLDEDIIATGAAYDFSPTSEQCGSHTLTVKASGEGRTYSLTREISVALD